MGTVPHASRTTACPTHQGRKTQDPMIQFDDTSHTYTLDGRRLMSVTGVWGAAGFDPYEGVPRRLVEGRSRLGKVVHAVCALDEAGQLDDNSVAPEAATYLAALRQFRALKKPKMRMVEQMVFSKRWQY